MDVKLIEKCYNSFSIKNVRIITSFLTSFEKGLIMKRKLKYAIGIVLVLIPLLLPFVYKYKDYLNDKPIDKTVIGQVVENQDTYLIVRLDSDGLLCEAVKPDNLEDLSEFKVGDKVSITYSGGVLETSPGMFVEVSKIELVKE